MFNKTKIILSSIKSVAHETTFISNNLMEVNSKTTRELENTRRHLETYKERYQMQIDHCRKQNQIIKDLNQEIKFKDELIKLYKEGKEVPTESVINLLNIIRGKEEKKDEPCQAPERY
jgi:ribosome-binding protein aMBF1 (putative translation factor)